MQILTPGNFLLYNYDYEFYDEPYISYYGYDYTTASIYSEGYGATQDSGVAFSTSASAAPPASLQSSEFEGGFTFARASAGLSPDSGTSSVSAVSGAPIRAQGDFVSTPLFVTINPTNDEDGVVTFTAPDNLGTFIIRAYAATGEL